MKFKCSECGGEVIEQTKETDIIYICKKCGRQIKKTKEIIETIDMSNMEVLME